MRESTEATHQYKADTSGAAKWMPRELSTQSGHSKPGWKNNVLNILFKKMFFFGFYGFYGFMVFRFLT